ncbi:MAG TPA: argininosuccinate lyase, partial [Stellaceae bacterium]|nr:argininosuccinate lyase [Stellaceae bacterium]
FESFDTLELCLAAATGMARDLVPDKKAMKRAAEAGYGTATDLADWLTLKLGLPFREAHRITGSLVKRAEELGVPLASLPLKEMRKLDKRITEEARAALTVEKSAASRTSFGGTAPANVARAAKDARARFLARFLAPLPKGKKR